MDPSIETRWQKGEGGSYVMPPLQSQFLDWLLMGPAERLDADEPDSQAGWARANGVNPRTVREWKGDHRFRAEWDRRAADKNVSTERVQAMLDRLYEVGMATGDVAAMKLWLDHSSKMRPPRAVVHEGEYAHLSNDDLVAAMEGLLRGE